MPPKIRSPTPDSEYDELDEDPVPRHALPIHLSLPATASTSRQASFTSTPASAFQGAPTSDDDDLSSLEDSDDDSRARQQEMYAQMERSDDEHEHARSAGRAYSEEDVEMDELDQLDDDDEDEEQDDEFAPTSKKGRTAPRAPATASSASASGQASGIKIKFKLGGGGAAAAAVPRAPSSVAGSSAKGSASKRGGGKKGKGKKKASFGGCSVPCSLSATPC